MSQPVSAQYKFGDAQRFNLNFPDECPMCHRNVAPIQISAIRVLESLRPEIDVAFRCTNLDCDSMFIGIYKPDDASEWFLEKTTPQTPENKEFEETILKLSPSFIKIYNQAIAAEAYDLDQIVGMGLRKALEFLIKDFVIKLNPEKDATIRKTLLGNVIKNYIEDQNLKRVAERAVWLGNDETHYERVWTNQDLDDLKRLIHLSVNWIDNVLTSQAYIDDMPEPEKEKK